MVDYFHQHSTEDEPSVQAEVDRYIGVPAQALAYKVGQLKIIELREKAKKAFGDRFSFKEFHNVVLSAGTLPLELLERQVDSYIRSAR